MVSVLAHEAARSSECDECKKEKAGQKREQHHSPFRFPPLTTYHRGTSTWRICAFTIDMNAHNAFMGS